MTVNVGSFDRLARLIVGAALIAFALGYIARHGMELGRLDRRDPDFDRAVRDLPGLQPVRMVNAMRVPASAPHGP